MSWSVGELIGYVRVPGAAEADAQILGLQRSLTLTDETLKRTGASLSTTEARLAGVGRQGNVAAEGSARFRAAQLSQIAAAERYNRVLADENASVGRLATAEAGLVRANQRVMASQPRFAPVATEALAAERGVSRFRSGLASAVATGAKFGLMLGGFELARKGFELALSGKDLTTSLNGVQAAAGATDAQMVKVRTTAVGLGKDMRVPAATAVDAADAINDLVRAGMKLPRAMAAARPALLLASAAQVETADAARYLGDTLDDFQLPASQAVHVANSLAGAATSAGGGLTDMFEALKYAGPYARAAGVDVDSIVAAIAELAKGGIQGSMAGTGLRMMLQSLAKASPAAQSALHALGVEAWDSQGRFVGLRDLFGQLHDAQERFGPDSQQFLKNISTAFGARAATIVASFAHRGIEGYDQFLARVKSGDVQHYADVMNRGVAAGFAQIHKELVAFAIDGWDKAEPAVASAVGWIGTNLPGAFHTLGDVLGPTVHIVGGTLVAAWHGLVMVLGPVASALGTVTHFLADQPGLTTGVATGVLAMWAAWKGYQIVSAVVRTVQGAILTMKADLGAWGSATRTTLTGAGSEAHLTGLVMQAEFAKISAAAQKEAAEVAAAVARQEESYAQLVAASDDATTQQVANAYAVARAAQLSADEQKAAAIEAAAAADAAAANIDEAGALAGAGWSAALGPLAAIGLGVGLLTMAFGDDSSAAADNAKIIQGYADSLKQNANALASVNLEQTAKNLKDQGAIDLTNQLNDAVPNLGLNYGQLTLAVNGSAQEFDSLYVRLMMIADANGGVTAGTTAQRIALGHLTADQLKANYAYNGTGRSALDLAFKIKQLRDDMTGQMKVQQQLIAIQHQAQVETNGGVSATATQARSLHLTTQAYLDAQLAAQQNTDQTKQQTAAFQAEGDAASLLQQALDGLAGVNLSLATARTSLASADLQVAAALTKSKTAVLGDSAAAVANQQAIQSQVQAAQQLAKTIGDADRKRGDAAKGARDEVASLKASRKALEDVLAAHHELTPAVKSYIESLYNVKGVGDYLNQHPVVPKVNPAPAQSAADALHQKWVDTASHIAGLKPELDFIDQPALSKLIDIHNLWNDLHDKSITLSVGVHASSSGNVSVGLAPLRAAGGPIPGSSNSDRSDNVPILATPNEHMWTAPEVRAAGGHSAVAAIRRQVLRGYAAGGPITKGSLAGQTVWVYDGWRYASKRDAENARSRDESNMAGEHITTGRDSKGKAVYYFAGQQYASMREAANAESSRVRGAKSELDTKDLKAFIGQLGKTTDGLVSAEATLIKAVKAAGASSKVIDKLAEQQQQLIGLAKQRDVVESRLATAREHLAHVEANAAAESSTVKSAVLGSFDVTAAGTGPDGSQPVTVGSMIAQARQAELTAQRWDAELEKLHKSGGISDELYRQLREKGPSDVAQVDALAHASKSQLSSLTSAYAGLGKIAGAAGSETASGLYGPALATAKGLIDGVDPKKNPQLAKAVKSLSKWMFGVGAETSKGLAQGLSSQDEQLKKAMRKLGHLMADEIRDELGIHSASRVGHEIGAFFSLGVGNGVLAQDRHVRDATRHIGRSMRREAEQVLSGHSGGHAGSPADVMGLVAGMAEQVTDRVMQKMPERIAFEVDKRVLAKANREGDQMLARR